MTASIVSPRTALQGLDVPDCGFEFDMSAVDISALLDMTPPTSPRGSTFAASPEWQELLQGLNQPSEPPPQPTSGSVQRPLTDLLLDDDEREAEVSHADDLCDCLIDPEELGIFTSTPVQGSQYFAANSSGLNNFQQADFQSNDFIAQSLPSQDFQQHTFQSQSLPPQDLPPQDLPPHDFQLQDFQQYLPPHDHQQQGVHNQQFEPQAFFPQLVEQQPPPVAYMAAPVAQNVDVMYVDGRRATYKMRILKLIYELAQNAPDGVVQRQAILAADPFLEGRILNNKSQYFTLLAKHGFIVKLRNLSEDNKGKFGITPEGIKEVQRLFGI